MINLVIILFPSGQGTFGLGSSLCLMDNRLTRFEANVFKPFLEQVIVNYNTTTSDLGFVDIFMSKIRQN